MIVLRGAFRGRLARRLLLMSIAGIALLAIAAPSSRSATADQHEEPTSDDGSSRVGASVHFEFHSQRWINLHHFLYQWARSEQEASPRDTRPRPVVPEREVFDELSEEEQRTWASAVDHYRQDVIVRSLTFDDAHVALKAELLDWDPVTGPERRGESDDPTVEALLAAADVYAGHWWPEHDRVNRARAAEILERLRGAETPLAAGVARAYGVEWPAGRVRTDLTVHANWAGAYTTNDPDHITLSSVDPDFVDWGDVEILFHEVGHTRGFGSSHDAAVMGAFDRRGAEPPDRLWHALLFYTAGELVAVELARRGRDDYRTYAERRGFYERPEWVVWRAAFDTHWRALLAGQLERDEALDRIAADVSG